MALAPTATLQLPPLKKKSMDQLVAEATRAGIPPEDYARQLVEHGLALQREAEELGFAQIMKPVRQAAGKVSEAQIVRLVEKARASHHASIGRGKKG